MELGRTGRAAIMVVLVAASLYYLQFGLQALAHHVLQGALALVGAAALGWGVVRCARREPAAPVVFLGTLPVLVFHAVLTIEDPGEMPFLVGSIPAPLIAGIAWLLRLSRGPGPRPSST